MIKIQAAKVIISRDIEKCLVHFIKAPPSLPPPVGEASYHPIHETLLSSGGKKYVVTDNNVAYFLATFVIFDYLCVQ